MHRTGFKNTIERDGRPENPVKTRLHDNSLKLDATVALHRSIFVVEARVRSLHSRRQNDTPITSTMRNLAQIVGASLALTEPYLRRLDLDASLLTKLDKVELLRTLHGRHLERIPFENTAQHGVAGGPAVLDLEVTADKVFRQRRGGFCMELNGLFGAWLEELGYTVTLVPAIVFNGESFRDMATHVVLIVSVKNDGDFDGERLYLCDVGFGEPAHHPLQYTMDHEQQTPEGMLSKMVLDNDHVTLYWKKNGSWRPRLRWSHAESMLGDQGPALLDFEPALRAVQSESSPFTQKLIACSLTPKQKTTVAGNKVKITRNRFSSEEEITYEVLDDSEQARKKLEELFGYPLESSVGLDLTRSTAADAGIWTQF